MYRVVAIIFLILFAASITILSIVVPTANDIKIELAKTKAIVDSLSKISYDKYVIKKTLLVAYPQLTNPEAVAYAEIFYMYCFELHKVPFAVPASIISVESEWNPTLISYANCRGLGQIGCQTASDESKKLGTKYDEGVSEYYDINNLASSLNYFCTAYEKGKDTNAIRTYIAGSTWNRAIPNSPRDKYIKAYEQAVNSERTKVEKTLAEIQKLIYISKGVLYDGSSLQNSTRKR